MVSAAKALSTLPAGLRDPLLAEYRAIVQNYFEHRWSPSELSGGRFCEVVYTILEGHAAGTFKSKPAKPSNFLQACRALEAHVSVPRSFQILIPRLLPALYEIRNNRGVGHVGGDVDPNHIDATAVLTTANWIMAELVRVYHALPIAEAQAVVDSLVERRSPLVWEAGGVRRLLVTDMSLQDHVLVLVHTSTTTSVTFADIAKWTEYKDHGYLKRLIRQLHSKRLIEFNEAVSELMILPPGAAHVESLIASRLSAPASPHASKRPKARKRRK